MVEDLFVDYRVQWEKVQSQLPTEGSATASSLAQGEQHYNQHSGLALFHKANAWLVGITRLYSDPLFRVSWLKGFTGPHVSLLLYRCLSISKRS